MLLNDITSLEYNDLRLLLHFCNKHFNKQILFFFIAYQRGKFYPQLTNLVRINTPRSVQAETKKAFKKMPNLESAITSLCTLKGVGTTLASGSSPLLPVSSHSILLRLQNFFVTLYLLKLLKSGVWQQFFLSQTDFKT